MSLSTPILYLIFNRPSQTEITFQRIREIQPQKLYIAADGSRENKEGESEKVSKARAITEKIDWPCEVKRLYREKNLGCGKAVSEAITWFFEQEEQGIIIEDDILPDPTFFKFCEELLEKYKYDEKVMQISGCNFLSDYKPDANSYFFTQSSSIWGWATWSSRWKKYTLTLPSLPNTEKELSVFLSLFPNKRYGQFELQKYRLVAQEPFTWDIQWNYCRFIHLGLNIFPQTNLVDNIGFHHEATHTRNVKHAYSFSISPLLFPLKHPVDSKPDKKYDIHYLNFELKIQKKAHWIKFVNTYLYFIVTMYKRIKNG